jgi:hypothetical protein
MPTVSLSEPTTTKLFIALKEAMVKVRGFDLIPGKKVSVRIPRTTNADVRLLLGRWTGELIRAGVTTGQKKLWDKIVAKWEPAAADMLAQAKGGDANEPFGDNVRFWTTTAKLSIELAAIKGLPSEWDFAVEALAEAIVEAPAVILDVTKKVAGKIGNVAEAVATGAGKVVGGFFEGFGLPGIALIAGAAYLYTRKRR